MHYNTNMCYMYIHSDDVREPYTKRTAGLGHSFEPCVFYSAC